MFFDFFEKVAKKITGFVSQDLSAGEKDLTFLERELSEWSVSKARRDAIKGFLYYEGEHDILYKKRMAIGKNGELTEVKNLPNRKDIDNQYAIAVNKKTNYLLGNPISFEGDNAEYVQLIQDIFSKSMMKKIKSIGKKALNGGLCWVFPFYGDDGKLKFKVFPAYEIKAIWKDAEHEELDYAIRTYSVSTYEKQNKKIIEKVEVYKRDGIYKYTNNSGKLIVDSNDPYESYVTINNSPYNWNKIPLIPFRYNENEKPLLNRVKPLQDAVNELISMFHNNMLEDNRNTILVIENYDGTDLGEFRQNLSQYGAVKVRSGDGSRGGVSTLQIAVNASNYQTILELLKNAIVENACSFDGKMLKSGTPNQMNILSMYQDIDIDTNDFEAEFQSSMEELLYFINVHLSLVGEGDFFNEKINVIFNRDMLMNEAELMQTLNDSGVKISNRTLLTRVPFVNDVDKEIENIKQEKEESMDIYQGAFNPQNEPNDEDDDE